jgi:predicted methyltransferase
MWNRRSFPGRALVFGFLLLATACEAQQAKQASTFPEPNRPVSPIVSPRYSDEDARDSVGEFETVVKLAGIGPGMRVADIGAGEGYYTVRLSPLVGLKGRVLAQDIVPATRDALAERVNRERLDNVAVKLGEPNDPKLPKPPSTASCSSTCTTRSAARRSSCGTSAPA